MSGRGYVQRQYREMHRAPDLAYFAVRLKETDLSVGVDRESFAPEVREVAEAEVARLRADLESYIQLYPEFLTSLVPVPMAPGAPAIVRTMVAAAARAGVGPMAAVAGAIAQAVGERLRAFAREVIVENGGDIYLCCQRERRVALFAGDSPFSNRVAVRIEGGRGPRGVCTSSGTVGPSLSLGRADAALVIAADVALADAVATGAGNRVKADNDLRQAVEWARAIEGVDGIVVVRGKEMAAWGDVELVRL